MRKTVSMRCMIASDAACIIGGFIAAVLVIQLIQFAGQPARLDGSRETLAGGPDTATVSRAVKSDRVGVPSFDDRFGGRYWTVHESGAANVDDDRFGRVLWPGLATPAPQWPDPTDQLRKPEPANSHSNGSPKPQPAPSRMIGCDPVASPLVEPDLARFSGRCFAGLPVPPQAQA
jgi:hypothetical protein